MTNEPLKNRVPVTVISKLEHPYGEGLLTRPAALKHRSSVQPRRNCAQTTNHKLLLRAPEPNVIKSEAAADHATKQPWAKLLNPPKPPRPLLPPPRQQLLSTPWCNPNIRKK